MSDLKTNLFQAIEIMLNNKKFNYDVTCRGRIVNIENDIYTVKIRGETYKIKSKFQYNLNEAVFVLFPEGSKKNLYLYPNK